MLFFQFAAVDDAGSSVVDTREVGPRIVDPVIAALRTRTARGHVTIAQGGQSLPMPLVGRVESLVNQQPGIGAQCTQIQLAHITQDDVGTRRLQLLPVPGMIDPHHQSETATAACLDPGHSILDDHGTLRGHTESTRRLEEHRRIRLAGQTLIRGHQAVNDHIKRRLQARGLQQSLRVTAGCDEAHGDAAAAQTFQQRHGSGINTDTITGQRGQEQVIFTGPQSGDRPGIRSVPRAAGGKPDAAGGHKGADAVFAAASVHVKPVVPVGVERWRIRSHSGSGVGQDGVEELLPGRRMHAGSPGNDPVHVEQHRIIGQSGEMIRRQGR